MSKKLSILNIATITIALVGIIALHTLASGESSSFNGHRWGSHINSFKGLKYNSTETFGVPAVWYYATQSKELSYKEFKALSIQYGFVENKLYGVYIKIDGDAAFSKIYGRLLKEFGKPDKENPFDRAGVSGIDYTWYGSNLEYLLSKEIEKDHVITIVGMYVLEIENRFRER